VQNTIDVCRTAVTSRAGYRLQLMGEPIHNSITLACHRNGSGVGIAAYGLENRGVGVRVPVGSRIFTSLYRPDRLWGQPPIQWVFVTLTPGIKRLGHEADHSPPTSVEVKKKWLYAPTPPYIFMA
jgi:hypothetical protein